MVDLKSYLSERKALVDSYLDRMLPPAGTRPARLHEAIRYSIFGEAKRVRPILCMAAAEACGANPATALRAGAAIELLHTYTLIHDDLPAMDDDDLRRGRPTCHIQFGEATAILAGDALLTLAFEWLADCPAPPPYPPLAIIRELAVSAGSRGVIGGQVEDLEAEGKPIDSDRLAYIHLHKTADLIRAACRIGAILAGAPAAHVASLGRYGEKLGLAFQVTDDILNATSDASILGKQAGTDAARGKLTYIAVYGVEASRQRAGQLVCEAKSHLDGLPGPVDPLIAIADFVVSRTS